MKMVSAKIHVIKSVEYSYFVVDNWLISPARSMMEVSYYLSLGI